MLDRDVHAATLLATVAEAAQPLSAAFATVHASDAYEVVRYRNRKFVPLNGDTSEHETTSLARMTYGPRVGGEWDADVSAKPEICAARVSS